MYLFGIIYTQVLHEETILPLIPSSMEPEICTKSSQILSEKLATKFPVTTLGYFTLKIARLDDAFSESFELEANLQSNPSRRSITAAKREYFSLKNSKTIGILTRLIHFVPTETLLTISRSLILLYLSYWICV